MKGLQERTASLHGYSIFSNKTYDEKQILEHLKFSASFRTISFSTSYITRFPADISSGPYLKVLCSILSANDLVEVCLQFHSRYPVGRDGPDVLVNVVLQRRGRGLAIRHLGVTVAGEESYSERRFSVCIAGPAARQNSS